VEVYARLFVRAGAGRVSSIGRVPSDPGGLEFGTRWRRRRCRSCGRFCSCRRAALGNRRPAVAVCLRVDGGFAPLDAFCRRVAGVSWL